ISVPGSNTITISESPETDSERITSTPSMPFSRSASSGTVIISSTSLAESPRDSVWTSTYGGVNSGRTSTGALRSCTIPTAITPTAMAMSNIQNLRLAPMIERIIADNLPAQMLSRCHSELKNRDTKLSSCQLPPVGISRVSMLGTFLRKIRCCPMHCTMFVAVFVAVKHTTSTRTFLCTQLSQQNSIYRGTYAHATPLRMFTQKISCVHEPYVPFLHKVDRLCLCAPCRPQGVKELPSPL